MSLALLVICAITWLLHACSVTRPPAWDPRTIGGDSPADPMIAFTRMTDGEWRVTADSGTLQFTRWQWGPGKHSMVAQTYGSGAAGEPWRAVRVYYRHPAGKQVRLFGLSPFADGVSEGTITFDGDAANAPFDLYQAGDIHRTMALRWTFDEVDRYRETLLEDPGDGFAVLAAWDHVRSTSLMPIPAVAEGAARPSGPLELFESLLGHTWQATVGCASGSALDIRTTFEWVPHCRAVYARTTAFDQAGESTHLLDAWVYYHTGRDAVRVLALSNAGGVHEGELTVLDDGGTWRFDLTSDEPRRATASHIVRLDLEPGGTLRQRSWVDAPDADAQAILDLRHERRD